jgi:hypothetical protein
MKVYQAINAIQAELSVLGITKDRKATQGATFAYRGIDDVYNTISPLLAKHKLVILPRMLERTQDERKSAKGNALFYTTVKAEFDVVSSEDGSHHTICTYGEAMDSGDKSTNKAMSTAYKYACFQMFAIPTEGDNDPDATVHQVRPQVPLLDADQLAEIRALIDSNGADESLLLTYVGGKAKPPTVFSKLEDVPVEAYNLIINSLKKKAKTTKEPQQ